MILSDEILVAYADGELDPEMVRQVAKALETDSEARKKVRVFRETAALVRAAYEGQPR